MKLLYALSAACAALLVSTHLVRAGDAPAANTIVGSENYTLGPNDIILVKVYREADLESRVRIGKAAREAWVSGDTDDR